MYYVEKEIEISACHHLTLDYESKCTQPHGHNWVITVYCKAKELNQNGMVIDFSELKQKIHGYLDHGNFNELLPFNPTAENIAAWVVNELPMCYKAIVEESNGNTAMAYDDEFPIESKYLM